MDTIAYSVLKLTLLLQLKHVLADFFLQSKFMLTDHWRYFHAGRAVHCLIHAAITAVVLVLMPTAPAAFARLLQSMWLHRKAEGLVSSAVSILQAVAEAQAAQAQKAQEPGLAALDQLLDNMKVRK